LAHSIRLASWLLDLGMDPDADTGDLTGVDHLESAAGVQNTDHGLSRTSTVRGGHRVPVMDLEHAPIGQGILFSESA
jgi:hypothetical protein